MNNYRITWFKPVDDSAAKGSLELYDLRDIGPIEFPDACEEARKVCKYRPELQLQWMIEIR